MVFPAIVIGLELISHMCADAFFDPMPTYWHVAAVSLVPASNLLVWYHLQDETRRTTKWFVFANGMAIAIAGFYALLFLPLLPLALVGIIVGLGLPPLAPLASFVCALKLGAAIHDRPRDRPLIRPLIAGLGAGLALLLALDVPPAATRLGLQWAASSEPSERERGLALLRTLGDDDLLLRLCYGVAGRPTGLLSALAVGRRRRLVQSALAAAPGRGISGGGARDLLSPARRAVQRPARSVREGQAGPASPTSSSTTITAAPRSADG